ncbi:MULTISPECIES: hypothetical protein [Methylosinus]|uniref:Uncharacterized protein n=1 Tax=Methylosinus trichosporium (strain ATCC 35070 / NCIMB 11131 / UNIQEM 75 / OB3b) TaxID=595536 RepID=A0A2D2CYJ9_METT3|nr:MULTISPECIES: hypothetical protein [Methylosinus]ATQ67823.1 hypothetical protein CQW49_07885 [Methylosinus trichosporium OB3b]OBS51844.1 hypothetical protein A8B73_14410 [Methylosinus sp. 3S-1]
MTFAVGDTVYRSDSGANAATVLAVGAALDEAVYRLAYAEGGDGCWPESSLYATLAARDAALGLHHPTP